MQIKKRLFMRGNSIAVIIPMEICKELKLKDGGCVACDIEAGKVTLLPMRE